jgi:hypothetical protein
LRILQIGSERGIQLFDCTPVPTMSVLLFGHSKSEKRKSHSHTNSRSKVVVNGWVHLRISELHAVIVRKIQREIESILTSKVQAMNEESRNIMREKERVVTLLLEKLLEVDV